MTKLPAWISKRKYTLTYWGYWLTEFYFLPLTVVDIYKHLVTSSLHPEVTDLLLFSLGFWTAVPENEASLVSGFRVGGPSLDKNKPITCKNEQKSRWQFDRLLLQRRAQIRGITTTVHDFLMLLCGVCRFFFLHWTEAVVCVETEWCVN